MKKRDRTTLDREQREAEESILREEQPLVRSPRDSSLESPEFPAESPIDFVVRGRFHSADLVGARWWNQSFETFAERPVLSRRSLLVGLPVAFGIGAAAIGGLVLLNRDDEVDVSLAAIELQRREGWNAGYTEHRLLFPGALAPSSGDMTNAIGMRVTTPDLVRLAERLRPEPHLAPYAVTTLFQGLADPASTTLVQAMRPVHTPAMDAAYGRGVALREMLTRTDAPTGVAVIADLPGPESVALAAGMADRFAPVFTFDNWPHPLGVVPSHLTLGASAYYLPLFDVAAQRRAAAATPAPPVFVLDANRLAPYRDSATQFDNRYVAPVPSADSLKKLGIQRLLYLRPDGASLTELDDLNTDFVAWEDAGIDVRAVALSDFTGQRAALDGANAAALSGGQTYYYGGHAHFYPLFWSSYGWGGGGVARSTSRRAPALPERPTGLSNAPAYRPTFRPTMFASRTLGGAAGFGKQKPSGFGRVSVRMSGGRVSSFGGSSRRSGSFGRSRSSSFG
jgi:hypothetical protein